MSAKFRLETAIEYAANAAQRWRDQYANWNPWDTFADGTTKKQVDDALNSDRHTPENIADIINPSWAYPQCSLCDERCEAVATFVREYHDAVSVCHSCAKGAASMLDAHGSFAPIPNAFRTGSRRLKARVSA